jgi:hypothetical protein
VNRQILELLNEKKFFFQLPKNKYSMPSELKPVKLTMAALTVLSAAATPKAAGFA